MYINLKKLRENAEWAKVTLGGKKLCAVVKADAYSHGMDRVASELEGIVDMFAVSNLSEAKCLKTQKDVLILSGITAGEVEEFISCHSENFILGVYDTEIIKCLNSGAIAQNIIVRTHIKVDSGMNRLGVKTQGEFQRVADFIAAHRGLKLEGAFSHFASGDLKECRRQLAKFLDITNGYEHLLRHIASSNTLGSPEFHLDMARVGYKLYDNIQRVTADVLSVKLLRAGESVSYNYNFTARRDELIAVIRFGYGDGLIREMSHGGAFVINGEMCDVIGDICMDMCVARVPFGRVSAGDTAEYISGKCGVLELSKKFKLPPHEITTRITRRVERIYEQE